MPIDEKIRDIWLRLLRRAAELGEDCLRDNDGSAPIIFSVFPGEGAGIKSYLFYPQDEVQFVDGLLFIGQVAIALDAAGMTVIGRTTMNVWEQWDDESDEAFRDRCLIEEARGGQDGVDALATFALYRDSAGVRRAIAMSRAIINADDGSMAFGKAEMSEQDSPLFGGMTELMPEQRPSALAQVSAAEWLVHCGDGEMKRLGIHPIDTAPSDSELSQ